MSVQNCSHFCTTAKNSKFINGGDPVPTLGEYATIVKCKKGYPLPRPTCALNKVHLDIVLGNGLGRLCFKYALIFIHWATRYIWVFGLKSLHANAIIMAFQWFRVEAGVLAIQFRTD